MNIIIFMQIVASLLMLSLVCIYIIFGLWSIKLRRLFKKEYIRVIQRKNAGKLYPLVPKPGSKKYHDAKRFLISLGWRISVEAIYMCKWSLFIILFFMLVTIQTTNSSLELNRIIRDVNFKHNIMDSYNAENKQNLLVEMRLFQFVDHNIPYNAELYGQDNKQYYIGYIESLLQQGEVELNETAGNAAQRLYYKILQTRLMKTGITPYVYIILLSMLAYKMPDILGLIKRKLIEDKKNWEILNCLIVFSIFGRMPPYSVRNILEHMVIVTDLYKPLLEELVEGLKKGGVQDEVFDNALSSVDRDELYELIETMKLARNTGLVNSADDIEDTILNTIKWIEIENITRRRTKMLYAMSAFAIVMGLGCIYFAYGLTVISNPANMLIK